ncbi:hypothetical protein N824_22260 [Pedobacter sp. V48]|nr:hypothetical protein N824_22260 [Pedobacter sp. V48]
MGATGLTKVSTPTVNEITSPINDNNNTRFVCDREDKNWIIYDYLFSNG